MSSNVQSTLPKELVKYEGNPVWKFMLKHPRRGEIISRAKAKTYESARKQIDNRFPKSEGWIVISYKDPDDNVVEFE